MSLDKPVVGDLRDAGYSFLIVAASYNGALVDALLARTINRLKEAGASDDQIDVIRVPGSNEVPFAVQLGIETGEIDCCIALGVLIRGDTEHYRIIGQSTSDALQMVALNHGVPVVNGIIIAENTAQAEERVHGSIDRGAEFAACAIQLAELRKQRLAAARDKELVLEIEEEQSAQ